MSTGIVDIEDTPDVATWNKKIHIKDDRFHNTEGL
jgi:hypothetical protein